MVLDQLADKVNEVADALSLKSSHFMDDIEDLVADLRWVAEQLDLYEKE